MSFVFFPGRHISVRASPWSPAGRCRVCRCDRRHAYRVRIWWWAESGVGLGSGWRLASVRVEILFNITSQREVP